MAGFGQQLLRLVRIVGIEILRRGIAGPVLLRQDRARRLAETDRDDLVDLVAIDRVVQRLAHAARRRAAACRN